LIQPSMLAVENKELVEIATEIKNRLKKWIEQLWAYLVESNNSKKKHEN
jgi:hypothetical protein